MSTYLSGRLWAVWLALVLATLLSWWTAAAHPFQASPTQVGAAIAIALGFGKVWLIGMHFMDLRAAPALLRRAFHAWTLLVASVVVSLLLL